MKLTKLPIPSRALDGIVSPRFPTRQFLPGRPFTNELLRERLHAITLPDSAATPPSFIPDKGKSGGRSPGRYANTARVRGRRNSKPVFRITFSLSSRQIRRPLSPLEGHLYSSFWRGRGREGEKNARSAAWEPSICHRPLRARPRKLTYERTTEPTCRVVVVRLDRDFRCTVPLLGSSVTREISPSLSRDGRVATCATSAPRGTIAGRRIEFDCWKCKLSVERARIGVADFTFHETEKKKKKVLQRCIRKRRVTCNQDV